MKKALVLAGGGTKGAYQEGVVRALRETGHDDWNLVTGTSVGALNAVYIVQKDYAALRRLYQKMEADWFIRGYVPTNMSLGSILKDRGEIFPALMSYLKDKGVDITPFYSMVHETFDPEKFFASEIDFGCIAAKHISHEPVYVTKEMMRDHGEDWLVATASAYPAFPVKVIDGEEYVDGGYFDNLPIDYALRKGAEEVLAIDLDSIPQHPQYYGRPYVRYIYPHEELYSFLDFDHEKLRHAHVIGYNDGYKAYGYYEGEKYTFEKQALPVFFRRWFREMSMLETRIKLAGRISGTIRSEEHITDILTQRLHRRLVREKEYFYAMADALLELCGADTEKIYRYSDFRRLVRENFGDALKEDFSVLPQSVAEIAHVTETFDKAGILRRLIHMKAWPEHQLFSENTILTVYPFEQACAEFVIDLLKEE